MAERTPVNVWEQLPDATRAALTAGWRLGVPTEATALYARWWQLETWLRDVAYVELRAKHGVEWAKALPPLAERREQGDRRHRHMQSPDAFARLAYLDTGPLFDLLERNWKLFEHALLDDRVVWSGRVTELRMIRNRIGHCRRPHSDDLSRVEQMLRDIDAAAFDSVAAYNRQRSPDAGLADPVVNAWVRASHADAARLVRHADRNYEVGFALRSSKRPWATPRDIGSAVSGTPGYLWHAAWYLRRTQLEPRRWWSDSHLDPYRDLIVFAGFNGPSAVEVSFAAVDDPMRVCDAIGACFDAVLLNHAGAKGDLLDIDDWYERWVARNRDLDMRVQIASAWTIVDDSTTPITMFGA